MHKSKENGKPELPTLRNIRRSCNKELYRTIKKLNAYVPPDAVRQAEKLYVAKVVPQLLWIAENASNRRKLADWWAEHIAPEIAVLWNVDQEKLIRAFRQSFGG